MSRFENDRGVSRLLALGAVAPTENAELSKPNRRERLRILTRDSTVERARVERFIERRFLDRFGALIADHYPTLLSLQSDEGEVVAAIGLRSASSEELFLEKYFDEPIERVILEVTNVVVPRSDILEIGNMASIGRAATARLIAASVSYLSNCRYRYAVATATEELRRMLVAFGFASRGLGAARADRLPDHGRSWGSYYEQNPEILMGEIRQVSDRVRPHARAVL
jgi:thermostable hemolysin